MMRYYLELPALSSFLQRKDIGFPPSPCSNLMHANVTRCLCEFQTGDQAAFNDIETQRSAERNYKFQWDEKLLDDTKEILASKERVSSSNTGKDQQDYNVQEEESSEEESAVP